MEILRTESNEIKCGCIELSCIAIIYIEKIYANYATKIRCGIEKSVIMKLKLAIEFNEQACPFNLIVQTSHVDTSSATVGIEDCSDIKEPVRGLLFSDKVRMILGQSK